MYTATQNGARITVKRALGDRAVCPECLWEVYAKRPDANIWHWAHMPGGPYCDGGGETEWHLAWKDRFADVGEVEKWHPGSAPEQPELPIAGRLCSYLFEQVDHCRTEIPDKPALWCQKHDPNPEVWVNPHRCDVWTPIRGERNPGRAFEFQNKNLDIEVMNDRRNTWVNVVWVYNGLGADSLQPMYGLHSGVYRAFSWNRVPQMIYKGVNRWGGGHQIYVHAMIGDVEVMLRVPDELTDGARSVEFNKGYDDASRVWAEIESLDSFVARFRAEAAR